MLGSVALVAPAHADDAVVRGTDFPLGTSLAQVGCSQIYDTGTAPIQPYIAQGPGAAPSGARSLGFDLPGGDAAGVVHYTASMTSTTTASLSGYAAQGTTGVAWAGYREPGQEGTDRVWFGRAPLSLPAGGWTSVEVSDLTYSWSEYDTSTGEVVTVGPQQAVPDFAADHGGTGAGLWALAFGCDGQPFNVDALRFDDAAGATTYDLEGLSTALSILGRTTRVVAGESVRIDGTLSATGGAVLPRATAILERRTTASDEWETVRVAGVDEGLAVVVEPPSRTEYRWRFVDRPLAEASTSSVFVVDVASAVQARVSNDGGSVVGSVAPGRAGLAVTLRSADGSGPLVRATTGPGGVFDLSLDDVEAGRYVVGVAATDGNLRGRSTPVRVTGDAPSDAPTDPPAPSPSDQDPPAPRPGPSPATPSDPPRPSPTLEPTRGPREPEVPADPPPAPTPAVEPTPLQPGPQQPSSEPSPASAAPASTTPTP
ncbi:MAG: hypothetical protein LH468_00340 [Nocardioides sp.]|nr:hypothetical protein [Nocardioides sp.]